MRTPYPPIIPNVGLRPVRTPVDSSAPVVQQARATAELGTALTKAGTEAAQVYTEIEEKSLKREAGAYISGALSSLQLESIRKLQDLKGSVPVGEYVPIFGKYYETEEQKILKNAPSDYAKAALVEPLNSLRTSMVSKAILYAGEEKTAKQRVLVQRSVEAIAATAFLDPGNFSEYKEQTIAAIRVGLAGHDGIPQSQLMEYEDRALGDLSSSYIRSVLESSPEAAEQALADPEVSKYLSGAQRQAVLNGIQSARDQRARQGLEMQHKATKAFMDDPASLAIMNGADPNDPQDMLDRQFIQLGDKLVNVPENRRSVLTKDQAALLADQFNKLSTPEEAVGLVQSLQSKYKDAASIAFRDMGNAGLPDHYRTLLSMDPVKDVGAFSMLFRATRDGPKKVLSDAKSGMASDSTPGVTFEGEVRQRLTEMTRAIGAEGGDPEKLVDSAVLIGSYAYLRGYNQKQSADLATQWILDKYAVTDVNNRPVRVNNELPVDDVAGYLQEYTHTYDYDQVTDERVLNDVYRGMTSFILSPDASSYLMVNDLGFPVTTKKGGVVRITIPEISKALEERKIGKNPAATIEKEA